MGRTRAGSPPPADDDDGEILYDHPGLNAWKKSGDAAVLSDPSFAEWDWTVYRLHTPDEIVRFKPATPRLYLGRVSGPLDLPTIQTHYGGGTFEFWGKFDGELRARIRQDIAGPRKDFNAPAVVAPVAGAAPATDPALLRMLENQQRQLDALAARPVAAPAGFTFQDALALADRMTPRQPGEGMMAELMSAFRQGIELRDMAGGSAERDKTSIILEAVMPTVEKIAGSIVTAAARGRAAVPVVPRPAGSHAAVVDPEPAAAPEPPAAAPGDHRMRAAVEVLARGLTANADAEDIAITIETVLNDQERGLLCLMPDAEVLSVLRQRAGGEFPVLERPEAEPYLAAVLKALREPDAASVP